LVLSLKRLCLFGLLCVTIFAFLGAGDEDARFNTLGHKMKCVCGGCNQVLLECNHVGCRYSDRMRGELSSALSRAESDNLVLQSFVQEYGPTVLIAPTNAGFNRVAWIMPYLALGLGLTTVVLIVRAWKMRPLRAHAGAVAPVSGVELERFREQARKETEV
jgi:cytochrome c-type biogenesis protein CcmH/NrfF